MLLSKRGHLPSPLHRYVETHLTLRVPSKRWLRPNLAKEFRSLELLLHSALNSERRKSFSETPAVRLLVPGFAPF
jgi:hypothetical protein